MNRDQALTATLDELRDALAEMDGWIRLERSNDIFEHKNTGEIHASDGEVADHPSPPTLDGADAAVRVNGWNWARYPRGCDGVWMWVGVHTATGRHIDVPDTGDKIADLYALALACRKAMENKA